MFQKNVSSNDLCLFLIMKYPQSEDYNSYQLMLKKFTNLLRNYKGSNNKKEENNYNSENSNDDDSKDSNDEPPAKKNKSVKNKVQLDELCALTEDNSSQSKNKNSKKGTTKSNTATEKTTRSTKSKKT